MKHAMLLMMAILPILPGCVSVKYNGAETKITKVDTPPVGQAVTAFVGDQLLQKGEIVEEKVLQVNRRIDGALYDINQGTYSQLGFEEGKSYYSAVGVVKSAFADPVQALMLRNTENDLCVVSVFNAYECYKGDFERKSRMSERGTSFQQTLIYSGRVGNKVNIGYREFSNNLARPAFNNDVEYDLSTSNVIGYKGAQLEVLKADNTSITYRVLRTFP